MTRCDQHEFLNDYLDGALSGSEARGFAEHLPGCDRCTAEIRAHQRIAALLAAAPRHEPSPRVTERVLDRVLPSRARRRAWMRRLGLAYAGAVAVCLGTFAAWLTQPHALAVLNALGVTASRRVVQLVIFTLNAASSTVLHVAGGWGWLISAGNGIAPLARALGDVAARPSVEIVLWLAALACVALFWWIRPRRHDRNGRMHHVGVLGF